MSWLWDLPRTRLLRLLLDLEVEGCQRLLGVLLLLLWRWCRGLTNDLASVPIAERLVGCRSIELCFLTLLKIVRKSRWSIWTGGIVVLGVIASRHSVGFFCLVVKRWTWWQLLLTKRTSLLEKLLMVFVLVHILYQLNIGAFALLLTKVNFIFAHNFLHSRTIALKLLVRWAHLYSFDRLLLLLLLVGLVR